jgi:glycine/D-amino acid oxidase-like deaminating enzyme
VIAGGGIVGAMVAWQTLRSHEDWRVLWIDRSLFAMGCSAYAGALLTPFGRTEAHRTLLESSFALLSAFEQEGDSPSIHTHSGFYVVSQTSVDDRRDWFISSVGKAADGTDRFRQHLPHFDLQTRIALGPFMVRRGRPTEFIRSIASRCRKSPSFSIWEGASLDAWAGLDESVQVSVGGEGTIETARLVLATGAWAPGHLASDAELSKIRAKRVAACHIEIPPAEDAPVVYLGDHDAFLLPLHSEKRWLFGFPSEAWDVPPTEFRPEIDDRDRAAADAILGEYSSVFAGARHGGRAFYDGYADDRVPRASAIGGDHRVVFAGAGAGSGFRYSFGVARRALELLDGASSSRG